MMPGIQLQVNGINVFLNDYEIDHILKVYRDQAISTPDGSVLDTDVTGMAWYREIERYTNARRRAA